MQKNAERKKQTKNIKTSVIILAHIFILVAAALYSLVCGAEHIPLSAFFSPEKTPYTAIILWQIRLPRMLLAAGTGALLAGSGAVFQMFFRNPLAEPGIMGISSGATLGAVTAECFGTGTLFGLLSPVSAGAFAGALISGTVVTLLAGKKSGTTGTVALLLCGTALGTLYSSLSSILLLVKEKELHKMYVWILGSFNGRGWNEIRFAAIPALAAVVLLLLCSRPLDLLSGGETTAQALGLELRPLRVLVIIGGSLATSAAVCAGGTIGFVGLIAPHIVRRLTGSKSRTLVPLSMLNGAVLLLISDTLARTVAAPSELPVGVVTSLLGAPFFISLVFSKKGLQHDEG